LEPLWRHSIARILEAEVMHLDATTLPTLVKKLGKVHNGTLWGMVGRNGQSRIAAYVYASTAKARGQRRDASGRLIELGPLDILDRRVGSVVLDAAGLFDAAFTRPDIQEVGCNMHARRYYVKAVDSADKRAAHAIRAFKALYIIEESVRGKSPDEVLAARREQSAPIYYELLKWAATYEAHEPPSSLLGRAVRYQKNHAIALTRFLHDGRLPIDNGEVERLHRKPALVRLNSLFGANPDRRCSIPGARAAHMARYLRRDDVPLLEIRARLRVCPAAKRLVCSANIADCVLSPARELSAGSFSRALHSWAGMTPMRRSEAELRRCESQAARSRHLALGLNAACSC
jgi:hypothetical protein